MNELIATCSLLLGILSNQPLSVKDHTAVEEKFYQVAPKCKEAIEEAKKKADKK